MRVWRRIHVLMLVQMLVIWALLSGGMQAARADASPTPDRPYHVYLPVVVKEYTPARPMTVTFQHGSDAYAGVMDTFISSYGDPYAPHAFEPILAVRWQRTLVTDAEAALIKYDLTTIPTTATIQSATLSLYVTGRSNINPMTLAAYQVLRPWQATSANWYSATQTTAWAAPGCNGINSDRAGLAADQTDVTDLNTWVQVSLTQMVQSWVRNPGANYGAILKPVGTSASPSVRYELASSLHPELGLRPRLTVTYILLPAPQPTVVPPSPTPTATPGAVTATATATPTVSPTPTPTWTPAPSWWNTNYSYRRRLTVQADAAFAVGAGYVVSLTLDMTQLVADGKLRADNRDWRIVAWNGWTWAELHRDVVSPAETWFTLLRPIAGNGVDDLYYVYYGNPDEESEPLQDRRQIYTLYDDFLSYDASLWPWPAPTGVEVAGGVLTVTAYNPTGGPADSCPGAYDCMLSRQTFGLGYQVEYRARHPDYVYGKKHDADQGFSDDGHSNEAKLRSYDVRQFQRVNRDGTASTVVQCCKLADTDWHIFRVARLDTGTILFQIDDSDVVSSTTHVPLMPLPVHIRAYSAEPFEPSRNVVDWVKVRPIVAREPRVLWGREESAEFHLLGRTE